MNSNVRCSPDFILFQLSSRPSTLLGKWNLHKFSLFVPIVERPRQIFWLWTNVWRKDSHPSFVGWMFSYVHSAGNHSLMFSFANKGRAFYLEHEAHPVAGLSWPTLQAMICTLWSQTCSSRVSIGAMVCDLSRDGLFSNVLGLLCCIIARFIVRCDMTRLRVTSDNMAHVVSKCTFWCKSDRMDSSTRLDSQSTPLAYSTESTSGCMGPACS